MVDVVDPETGLPSDLPQLADVMSSVEGFEHAAQPRLTEDQRRFAVKPDLELAVLALQDRQTWPELGESKLSNGCRSRSHGHQSAVGSGPKAVVHRDSCCPFPERVVTSRNTTRERPERTAPERVRQGRMPVARGCVDSGGTTPRVPRGQSGARIRLCRGSG